jgi:hypothetical protein
MGLTLKSSNDAALDANYGTVTAPIPEHLRMRVRMEFKSILFLVVAVVVTWNICDWTTANPLNPRGRLLQRLEVVDREMGDMKAYAMLIPNGVQADFRVRWDPSSRYSYANLVGRAFDPTTGGELFVHPFLPFEFLNIQGQPQQTRPSQRTQNGSTFMPLPQHEQAMAMNVILPVLRPGIQNPQFVNFENFPKTVQAYEQLLRPTIEAGRQQAQQQRQMGIDPGQHMTKIFSQRIRVKYIENQQAFEEDFYFVLMIMSWHQQANANGGQLGYDLFNWNLGEVKSIRAPAGKLDAATPGLMSIALSVRKQPQYEAVMFKLESDLSRAELRNLRELAAISRKNAAELAKIREQTYAQQQTSSDNIQGMIIDSIQGVEQWHTPGGTSYAIPQEWGVVWTNNHGDIYVTNDHNLNPGVSVDPALTWTQLQRR